MGCISSTIQYSWGFAACCKARWKQYSVDFHKWHVTVRLIADAVLMFVKFKTNRKAASHLNTASEAHISPSHEPRLLARSHAASVKQRVDTVLSKGEWLLNPHEDKVLVCFHWCNRGPCVHFLLQINTMDHEWLNISTSAHRWQRWWLMLLVVQGAQWLGAHLAFPRKPLLFKFRVYCPLWICYVLYAHTCAHTHIYGYSLYLKYYISYMYSVCMYSSVCLS